MLRLALSLLLLAGSAASAPTVPPMPVVRVATPDATIEDLMLIYDSAEHLGVSVQFVNYWQPGVVIVDLVNLDKDDNILGTTYSLSDCHILLWSSRDKHVLAHELAHALGLPHTYETGNLMYPARDGGGTKLTKEQRAQILYGTERLNQCNESA